MAPAASSRCAWIQCGFQRRLWLICSSTPARSQAAIIRSHSASDRAIGFSQMMARVAGAAAHSLHHGAVQLRVGGDDAQLRPHLLQHLPVVVVQGVDAEAVAELEQLVATAVERRPPAGSAHRPPPRRRGCPAAR